MKTLLLLFICGLSVTACTNPPPASAKVLSPTEQNQRRVSYDAFVSRRTAELESMGGPYKDKNFVQQKVLEEAGARFGQVPPDWQTTWTWGQKAGDQVALNNQLDKLQRKRTAR